MAEAGLDAVADEAVPEPAQSRGWRPPFTFAKRHGILVSEQNEDHAVVMLGPQADPRALVEVRRFVGCPLRLERISKEQFDALLASSYEQRSNEAMQMMEDLGEDLDLFTVAQALPETEDLLESEDDAPIIRLINALLTEAIKENASDIHIEPFENRLVVRFRVDGVLREVLQPQRVLAPLLGIDDPRTSDRISFAGGIRGTDYLKQQVDEGKGAVAFSMVPVTVEQLMAISDANQIMAPKSTWFEPKLRSGLFVHTF